MEERLKFAEKAIQELHANHKQALIFNESVAGSMEKIAVSLDQLNSFQTATETHRQHDVEFRFNLNRKIDDLMEHREKDLNAVFKEMRGNNKELLLLQKDHDELKNEFDEHVIRDEKMSDRFRNMFAAIFTGSVLAGITYWLTHHDKFK